MRAAPASRRDTERRAARPDAGPLALEIRAVGKRQVAVAVAPGESPAGAGVPERFHVLAHGHGIGLVVHEAVAHADAALGHDAIVLPHQARSALYRGGTQYAHAVDRAVPGEHRIDACHRPRVAVAPE